MQYKFFYVYSFICMCNCKQQMKITFQVVRAERAALRRAGREFIVESQPG